MGFDFKGLIGKIGSKIDVEKIKDTAVSGAKKAATVASEVADLNANPSTIEGMKNRIALYEQKITELKAALAKAEAQAAAKPAAPASPPPSAQSNENKPAAPASPAPTTPADKPSAPPPPASPEDRPATPPPASPDAKPEAPHAPTPGASSQPTETPESEKPKDDDQSSH